MTRIRRGGEIMLDLGKKPVLGIGISAVDYEAAVKKIMNAADKKMPFGVSALAVHGVMEGFMDTEHKRRLNGLELVTPDGQPVRWALNLLHKTGLQDRVYGPDLTLKTLAEAEKEKLPVYFYGATDEILSKLIKNLNEKFPKLRIAGYEPSKFRKISINEKKEVINRIIESGAKIVFVGLGCPRQEVWAFEYKEQLQMPILAVGAAFAFHAGLLDQAPKWMQDRGLEWLFRLLKEPRRLAYRYLVLNPKYVWNVFRQYLNPDKFVVEYPNGNERIISYG